MSGRRVMGPSMRHVLDALNLKPALMAVIQRHFDCLSDLDSLAPAAPKRLLVCLPAQEVASSTSVGQVGDIAPDIKSGASTRKLLNLTSLLAADVKMLGESDWKVRHQALVSLDNILRSRCPLGMQDARHFSLIYIKVNLWLALKAALGGETNKNLVVQLLGVLSAAIEGVGSSINHKDSHLKSILPVVMALIGDNKKAVRDAVCRCLDACKPLLHTELMLKNLPLAMQVESPFGRQQALAWSAAYLMHLSSTCCEEDDKPDVSGLVTPLLDSLLHRTSEVRAEAERCLVEMIKVGGSKQVPVLLRDLKPALLQTLQPVCDKALAVAKGCTHASEGKDASELCVHDNLASSPVSPSLSDSNAQIACSEDRYAASEGVMSTPPSDTTPPSHMSTLTPPSHMTPSLAAPPSHISASPTTRPASSKAGSAKSSPETPTTLRPHMIARADQGVGTNRSATADDTRRSASRQARRSATPTSTAPSSQGSITPVSVRRSTRSDRQIARDATTRLQNTTPDVALEWLLKRNVGKEARERKHLALVGAKAKVVGEDGKDIEGMLTQLQDAFVPLAHPQLLSLLFSTDLKRQVLGLRRLSVACEGIPTSDSPTTCASDSLENVIDSMIDNADLLLRLASLRIAAAQVSCPLAFLLQPALWSLCETLFDVSIHACTPCDWT